MRRAQSLTVIAVLALWASSGAVRADTIVLQAEDYMAGGEGIGYHELDYSDPPVPEKNHGGQYRTAPTGEGVDVEVAYVNGVPVGYNVGWTNGGEWFKLTTDPGTWTQNPVFGENKRYLVRARKAGFGGLFRIDIDGTTAVDGISNLVTGGWQVWDDSYWALTKFRLTPGPHEVTSYVVNGGFNLDYIEFQSTDLDYAAPIPQKLDPRTGCYYERVGNQTWDQARVNSASLGTFHGVQGTFAVPESRIESEAMAGLGDAWIALTDANVLSSLDAWDPAATLGTDEGGDESLWADPPAGQVPVYGQRGYGWKRLDGQPLTFQLWNSGEPNNSTSASSAGGEDAAHLYTNGRWNDQYAGTSLDNGDYELPFVAKYATSLDQAKFQILERKSIGSVKTLADAETLLSLPSGDAGILQEAVDEAYAISFQDPEAGGGYSDWVRSPFFTNSDADDNHFALKATAQVEIPEAGEWTFAVAHDDYTKLTIDGNTVTSTSQVDIDLLCVDFATAGVKSLELIFQEQEGGAYVQLLATKGKWAFNADMFRLIGDEYGGGLRLVTASVLPGDANRDGKVDEKDASILATNWLRTDDATWSEGDFNDDGHVDDLDASILAANWHSGVGTAVPEPAAGALLVSALLALVVLAVRRRG